MTELDFEQIERDRGEGSPGPLTYRIDSFSGDCGITAPGCSVVMECFADIRHAGEGARNEAEANASRIARVPDLEAYALAARAQLKAAEKMAEAIEAWEAEEIDGAVIDDARHMLYALAAYRAAAKGGGK